MFWKAVSGPMLILLVLVALGLILEPKLVRGTGTGTIYIRPDGSIDPLTAPISTLDNVTYTLTGDITSSADYCLTILRSNIVVDGNGHTLQGSGNGTLGIWLPPGWENVTIQNTHIGGFTQGIHVFSSSSNSIIGNSISADVFEGIFMENSSNDRISGNSIGSTYGIELAGANNERVSGNSITGGNWGIYLYYTSGTSIVGNDITGDGYQGILFTSSSGNSIVGNTMTNDHVNLWLDASSNNYIEGNSMALGGWGIYLSSARSNSFFGNNITANSYCAIQFINSSSYNTFLHNNIENNTNQVYIGGQNTWDDGYPNGGNFWSDYTGVDFKSGQNQDQPGSDGVGDTPYIMDSNNTDHYPLMRATGSEQAYEVTFVAHCNIEGVDVGVSIAEDGASTGFSTPSTFPNLTGVHTFKVPNVDVNGHPFKEWDNGETSTTITVWSEGTYTAIYDAQMPPIRVPEDYTSVQAAIDAATGWTTIQIGPGVYNESIIVNKPLIIIGRLGSEPVFNGGGSGIAITLGPGASGSIVAGIVITGWNEGIVINGSSDCKIYNNIMSLLNNNGIVVQGASATNNQIYGNMFQNSAIAVDVTALSVNNNVSKNVICLSTTGLELESNQNIVCENMILNDQVGLSIVNSNTNIVYHNDFVNNTVQVSVSTSTTSVWDNGYPSGGNYWSDYNGADANHDGVGDTPYTVATGQVDRYPLVQPFNAHDIGITDYSMSKTVVGEDYSLNLEIKILNYGSYDENCLVTAFCNASTASAQTAKLARSNSTILMLTWNTSGFAYGNYSVRVCAGPVQNELDISDNNCTYRTPVHVGVPGDISSSTPGVYDGVVNMKDIAYMVALFNTKPGLKTWNPNADVNGDGVCNMKDIAIAIINFNQHE